MTDEGYRKLAKQKYHKEGSVEVDDDAVVSRSYDPGAYVAAWVWVDYDREEDDEPEGVVLDEDPTG